MRSIRRYAVYLACAALALLILNHYKYRFASTTRRPTEPSSTISKTHADESFRWESVNVDYPVQSLTPLPTAQPNRLPRVQFNFPAESEETSSIRKTRLDAVKTAFGRCWNSYRKHAWMHDELAPISGSYKDTFGGWAANMVDNLDSLWIIGFKDEFDVAVEAIMDIDLSKHTEGEINVFETTIRHLGGLLSAYDLSGDDRLLEKAKEFGEMLLKAFDTPNRMPITRWDPVTARRGPQQADDVVLVAEIGSLSMEFTRLSQVTGDARWYDAVERIVAVFDEQQRDTHLPGMWPVVVNARDKDFTQDTMFTLSAMSDSLYEYFPKMHALLGGVEPVYKKLYDDSMATAIKHNLWRPMTPENVDILISGNVRAKDRRSARLDPQGQHLVCFAGGMFALGGKLFNEPAHVEIGQKLADGCIYAYKALPLGIMPEDFHMVPCESREGCMWDDNKWKEEVEVRSGGSFTADEIIANSRLPPGFTEISDRRYILRPEAIESVFILYRITGEQYLQDAAWDMFNAIINATETPLANAALRDVTYSKTQIAEGKGLKPIKMDSMESFWMAETLKYFFLMFSEPDVISLDEWVFNTEAHPFKRRLP
ncbi:Hypothetical protein R9X50_00693500 [Acrodontium crateriforme]|uniref:alpha-1,2-Mannosidase n=1 Tax=Acrodontium crateriforme TaxID=150365 RepID=A0AAQ3RBV7_9PEZI|nr:Hypothetical protein R9X50_00693500 [Acrodontium crateriforme]